VVTLCSWGVKAEWFIPLVDERVGGRCDPSLARAIPERFSDEVLMTKRDANLWLLYFTLT